MRYYILLIVLYCIYLSALAKSGHKAKAHRLKEAYSKQTSSSMRRKAKKRSSTQSNEGIVKSGASKAFQSVSKVLQSSANKALSATALLSRNLKIHLSSNFEVLLLKMTFPNDEMIHSKDIQKYLATIKSFVPNKNLYADNNPYRVTLRKLWKKMVEKDARTKLKALYLLHLLSMSTEPDDNRIFRALVERMVSVPLYHLITFS
jgi:hypothetical protein